MITAGAPIAELSQALSEAGISAPITAATRIDGGNNSRSWMITVGDRDLFAKQYFADGQGDRDRLHSEVAFLHFANRVAPRAAPSLVGASRAARVLVTEFVDGEAFAKSSVCLPDVEAAANFVARLNSRAHRPSLADLPVAADASFALKDHLDDVELRLGRLDRELAGHCGNQVVIGLVHDIRAAWAEVRGAAITRLHEGGFDLETASDENEWVVSPSDFGFHNALKRSDGTICFLDFEYAGWDDCTKLIGDFFAQPAIPVPLLLRESFVDQLSQSVSSCLVADEKARALSDVFTVKWACIALNIFLPRGRERRAFADRQARTQKVMKLQTSVARRSLENLGRLDR